MTKPYPLNHSKPEMPRLGNVRKRTTCNQAARAYAIAELGRMADFMERHSLTGQFYQEDEQGKR